MDEDPQHTPALDWRIFFGVGVTSLWICAGLVYLTFLVYLTLVVGWSNFLALPTADIGSFFEGAFAPPAFLWLRSPLASQGDSATTTDA